MERKIGEIFEYNDEWYQCIESSNCVECAFNGKGKAVCPPCEELKREDGKEVIFKKLEKVGEPIFIKDRIFQKLTSYNNSCKECVFIEIKQNQENMEEKELKLKPFDLEKAKDGKPVCTRDGRKARIICFDRDWDMHIVALVADPIGETVHYYLSNGKVDFDKLNDEDLMMLPEKKEGWVNIYRDIDNNTPYTENDNIYSSRDKAKESAKMLNMKTYIDTVKISWEE